MKNFFLLPPSHRVVLTAVFLAATLASWAAAPAGYSQAVSQTTSNAALTPLLAKLKAQQDQMAANQTKIEAQTATLKEEVRQAKIYAGRGGGRR